MQVEDGPFFTIASSAVRGILNGADSIGVSADSLCDAAGIEFKQIRDLRRVSGQQFIALWEAVARLSNNEDCGLIIGTKTTPSSAHILGYLLMNCRSVGQAVDRYIRYQRIISNALDVSLARRKGCVYLTVRFLDQTLSHSRPLIDWVVAGEAAMLRSLTRHTITPAKVCFTHPAPEDNSEYLRVFQAPVLFERDVNALVLFEEDMSLPVIESDSELFVFLERETQENLESLDHQTGYAAEVLKLLYLMIADGRPTVYRVAAELKMSTRSLQLKLQAEGISYREILDNLLRRLAVRYLENPSITISEVGFMMGYSDPSSFHRAFKRWTGETPASFRRNHCLNHRARRGASRNTARQIG